MKLSTSSLLGVSAALCVAALVVAVRTQWLSADTALLFFVPAWCCVSALLLLLSELRRASETLAWFTVLSFSVALTVQPVLAAAASLLSIPQLSVQLQR